MSLILFGGLLDFLHFARHFIQHSLLNAVIIDSTHLNLDLEVLIKPALLISKHFISVDRIYYKNTIAIYKTRVEPEVKDFASFLVAMIE